MEGGQAVSESEKTIQEECYGTCWGAQQRIDELTQQLNSANDRIKRLAVELEEERNKYNLLVGDARAVIKAWENLKETP
jgi:molecular chaperone GrpE (heat shock protein)